MRVQCSRGCIKSLKQRAKILSEPLLWTHHSIGSLKEEVDFKGSPRAPLCAFGLSFEMSLVIDKIDFCRVTLHSWESTSYQPGCPIQHPISK